MSILQRKMKALLAVSKKVCLEVKCATTKDLFMSREQKAGQKHNTKQGNISFEYVQNENF